jgi:hypothetical protein
MGGSVRDTPRMPVGPEYVELDAVVELLVVCELEVELAAVVELEEEVEDKELVVVKRLTFDPVWITITPTMSAMTATAPTAPAAIIFRPDPFDVSAR